MKQAVELPAALPVDDAGARDDLTKSNDVLNASIENNNPWPHRRANTDQRLFRR